MWCPSSTNPRLAFDDVPPHVTYLGHGWRDNPPAGGARWLSQPTMQRINITVMDSAQYPPLSTIYSDPFFYGAFADGAAVQYYHMEGYTYVRLDGSTSFLQDPTGKIADLHIPQGVKQNAAAFTLQENVYVDYFDRP